MRADRYPNPAGALLAALLAALLVHGGIAAARAASAPSPGDEVPPPSVLKQLDNLKPQRPGVVDVYAVIVGADGEEDVFRKEAATVRETLDARLDTSGRSVTLVNHRASPQPEATLKSLAHVLQSVSEKMDREEDILFLHIASHGAANFVLVFKHPRAELYGLDPKYLEKLLASSRIRNRIVVISACYSGGFVPALANETTLVITAADQSRKSYGCGNDSEITDFSRAFYVRALRQTRSIPLAARFAQQIIHSEERATKRDHSYPQMQLGVLLEERLRLLERRLAKTGDGAAESTPAR